MMNNLLHFDDYERDDRNYGGSDDKRCIFLNENFYMVKLPNQLMKDSSLKTSASNNVISEYIGSHIFQSIGLETQDTILGYWKDKVAVACKDFRGPGEELNEFSWYMQRNMSKQEIGRIATYKQLYKTFNEDKFLEPIRQKAIERYWDIIVCDSLIGNFDRHKDNFGFIRNASTSGIRLAPVYDCGSCLYPSLAEEKFEQILRDPVEINKRIYDFPKIALNKNDNKNKESRFGYFELLSSGFDSECDRTILRIVPRINMNNIYNIIDDTPYISDIRKTFYKQMLLYRKEQILDASYENALDRLSEKNLNKVQTRENSEEFER